MPDFFDDESDADERKTKVEDLELIVKLAEAEASEKAAEARTLEAKAKIRDAEARLSEAEARIAEAGAKQYAADADRKTQIAAAHIATRGTMWAATIKAIAVIAVALIALFPVQTTGPYTPLIVGAFQSMNSGSSVPGVPTHTPLPSSAPSTTNQPTSVPTATITPHVQATVTQSPTPIPTNTIVPPQAIAPAELIQSLEVLTNRVPGATFTVSRSADTRSNM
ncbi:MAG: hypothetical protein UZ13_00114 [Chloroflexi bacterium OLB13]|nr:MAG: hypothetical protein UZ13_00114 [Chloroflexi bacterium OLB13]